MPFSQKERETVVTGKKALRLAIIALTAAVSWSAVVSPLAPRWKRAGFINSAPLVSPAYGAQSEGEEAERLARQLEQLDKFINHSSIARHVRESNHQEAVEMGKQADELRLQAIKVYEAGEYEKVAGLIAEARQTILKAVGLTKKSSSTNGKQQRQFKSSLNSVKGLLTAQERIKTEKNGESAKNDIPNEVERLIGKAKTLYGEDKIDEGLKVLKEAHSIIAVSLMEMRHGETKIKRLHFETKKDEYLYEIDRNNALIMLVEQVVEQSTPSTAVMKKIREHNGKASDLRQKAEKLASADDYETATKLLEKSSKECIFAIRRAGIYVPG